MPEQDFMDAMLVFPDPPPTMLVQTLDLAGYSWKAVSNASVAAQHEPPDGWSGAVVCADEDPEGAFGICRSMRKRDTPLEPILLLVSRRAAGRARAARGPLRRLLPLAVPPARAREPAAPPVLADGPGRSSGDRRVRRARPEPRDVPGGDGLAAPRPHLHGVRATEVLRHPPREGVHPGAAPLAGVGLRVLRGRPHGRRPRAAAPGQARRGVRRR